MIDCFLSRLALNYKGIQFNTEWIDLPDIIPTFKDLVPPNPTAPSQTLPIIKYSAAAGELCSLSDADEKLPCYVKDSLAIADFLDSEFSESDNHPSLYRGDEAIRAAQREFAQLCDFHAYRAVGPFVLSTLVKQLLPRGQEYFNRTRRAKIGGKSFEELVNTQEKRDATWKVIVDNYGVLATYVGDRKGMEILFSVDPNQKKDGDATQKHPTYAALVLAAILEWLHRCGEPEIFERVLELNDGLFRKVWQSGIPYWD